MSDKFKRIIQFIRELYPDEQPVSLHVPRFAGNEKKYLADCIDSTFVSYVGAFVTRFESMVAEYVGVKNAVALVNGTEALHIALMVARVEPGDEVLTQALTFVATANAIRYCGAEPVFLDVDKDTLGLSPQALERFLKKYAQKGPNGILINRSTGRRISACVPMHTFGHPARIEEIVAICGLYDIPVVEDSAEALGSLRNGRHTGTFGRLGVFSFNGNKIVTCGGGGIIVTDDDALAARAKHLTTTAKVPHAWEFVHDAVGYNYRMPNLNAAVGCAQMEQLARILADKRGTAQEYKEFCKKHTIDFACEPNNCKSNYWLNAIKLANKEERTLFIEMGLEQGVQCRPVWKLLNSLEPYVNCFSDALTVSKELESCLVNIPSSIRIPGVLDKDK